MACVAFVLFQTAWFACVLGAARGRPGDGLVVAAVVVAAMVALHRRPAVDAALIAVALAIGLVWDTALLHAGWIGYAAPGALPWLAPPWILALWALFAAMLREPMRRLHGRPGWSAALGAIGGPLSYAAAARLGAVTLGDPTSALPALALGWACATPALLALARRWESR